MGRRIDDRGGGSPRRRRRFLLPLIGAVLAIGGAESAVAAPGDLFQLSGPHGCVTDTGFEGCSTGRGLDGASSVAVAPDGRYVYVASNEAGAVTTFARDPREGSLAQPLGLTGCVSETGANRCQTGRALNGAFAIAISPDGEHAYTAVLNGLAVFDRDATTGELSQLPGRSGCVVRGGGTENCESGRGLALVASVIVSADGRNVYAAGYGDGSVASFARDPESGILAQLPGPAGCVSESGLEGCATGRHLEGAFSLALDPRGERLYVTANVASTVLTFSRDPASGGLTQLPGADGCVSHPVREGCTRARGLDRPNGVALSPDGKNVYVAASGGDGVVTLQAGSDGTLSQQAGVRGCASLTDEEGCARIDSLRGAYAVAVSSDESNVYVVSQRALTTLQRRRDGSLREVDCISQAGITGCADARALEGASSVALDPSGNNVYVSSYDSDGVSTFARDPRRGRVKVRISRVQRACSRRPFSVTVRVSSLLPLRIVRVFLGKQRIAGTKAERFRLRIDPRELSSGHNRIKVKATDVTGTFGRARVSVRRC